MHLSNRKKTWAESVKERVSGEGLELLARSHRASGHGEGGVWSLTKEHWEVLDSFKWARGDIL